MNSLVEKAEKLMSGYEKKVLKEYMSGKSAGEISKTVGRTEKSVNNALYRVKVKIKGLSENFPTILIACSAASALACAPLFTLNFKYILHDLILIFFWKF